MSDQTSTTPEAPVDLVDPATDKPVSPTEAISQLPEPWLGYFKHLISKIDLAQKEVEKANQAAGELGQYLSTEVLSLKLGDTIDRDGNVHRAKG